MNFNFTSHIMVFVKQKRQRSGAPFSRSGSGGAALFKGNTAHLRIFEWLTVRSLDLNSVKVVGCDETVVITELNGGVIQ